MLKINRNGLYLVFSGCIAEDEAYEFNKRWCFGMLNQVCYGGYLNSLAVIEWGITDVVS